MEGVTLLPPSRPLTRVDLEAMPDDGHRYELLDGVLLVSPAPRRVHQRAVTRLVVALDAAASPGLDVLTAPFDVTLADDTVLQPDVLVAAQDAFTERDLPGPPLLAVEVLSPSTRLLDLGTKRARFEEAGCPNYWVVDPDVPRVIAWELRDGQYVEVARADGHEPFSVAVPFPVELVPGPLVS